MATEILSPRYFWLWQLIALLNVPVLSSLWGKDDIPVFRNLSEYHSEFSSSVFLRKIVETKTVLPANNATSDFGKEFLLDGVLQDSNGGVMAFIRDKNKKQVLVVTSQATTGLRIIDAKVSAHPKDTEVTVSDGKEKITLTYGSDRFLKRVRFSSSDRAKKGQAVKPNQSRAKPPANGQSGQPVNQSNSASPPPSAQENNKETADDLLEKAARRSPRITLPKSQPTQ